ncbi:hypothetical protein [Gramella sp. Hel_I_59]|uniref:hypothetical protein n=1 Tax=Gramella sp. Hel_I_59 TaxID=1249978 RepID=UPI00114F4804|nr:hypothetical protein [Gramella sp. Hel_I_59]
MPSNAEIIAALDEQTLIHIEKLAGGNMAPNMIARRLSIPIKDFMRIWREEDSAIREAYERGRLELDEIKADSLKVQMETGNVTAVQIHDNQSRVAEFEAAKRDIFELD